MPERLEDAMRQYFDEDPDEWRLKDPHRGILLEVQRTPRIGVLDLAVRLEVPQSVCRSLINELVSLGYLMESNSRKDRLQNGLVLTDYGRSSFASLRARTLSRQL